jgi:hypothetical protein
MIGRMIGDSKRNDEAQAREQIQDELKANLNTFRKLVTSPSPRLTTVKALREAATLLCPTAEGLDALKQVVLLATHGLSSALAEEALLLFGLTPRSEGKKVGVRRHLAASHHRTIHKLPESYADGTYRGHSERELITELAAILTTLIEDERQRPSPLRRPQMEPKPIPGESEPQYDTPEPAEPLPQRKRRLRRHLINMPTLTLIAASLIVGVMVWVAETSPWPSPTSLALARLTREADRNLTGNKAPEPGSPSAGELGFGDPMPGGREIYHGAADGGYIAPGRPVLDSVVSAEDDERRFLEVEASFSPNGRKIGAIDKRRAVVAKPGEIVWVYVSIYNDAEETNTCEETGSTVATDTKLLMEVWHTKNYDEDTIRAWISADNTEPSSITDAVAVLTHPGMELVPDSSISREQSESSPTFSDDPLVDVESLEAPGIPIGGNGIVSSCLHNGFSLAIGFRQKPVNG